jgi:hypothetical protein
VIDFNMLGARLMEPPFNLGCLKRFIVLLPDAAVLVADDLRTRAGLSSSYDAIDGETTVPKKHQ